jgi:hypothetical protein
MITPRYLLYLDRSKGRRGVKVQTWFSANVKKLVSMKDLSIRHCKAHDCHVMLIVFLSIAIWAIKLEFLKMAITRMCYFFSKTHKRRLVRKS